MSKAMERKLVREQGMLLRSMPPRPITSPLAFEEQMVIVRGTANEWSEWRIAKACGADIRTVQLYKNRWRDNPRRLLRLPVITQLAKARYKCALCGNVRHTYVTAARHVFAHVLPLDIAKNYSLAGIHEEVL